MPRIPVTLAQLITAIRAVQHGKSIARRPRRKEAGSRRKERKNEERRKRRLARACFDSCTTVALNERCFIVVRTRVSDGIFASIDPIHRGHLSVRRGKKKTRRKLQYHFVRVDFPNRSTASIDLLRSQARIFVSRLSSSLTYGCKLKIYEQ